MHVDRARRTSTTARTRVGRGTGGVRGARAGLAVVFHRARRPLLAVLSGVAVALSARPAQAQGGERVGVAPPWSFGASSIVAQRAQGTSALQTMLSTRASPIPADAQAKLDAAFAAFQARVDAAVAPSPSAVAAGGRPVFLTDTIDAARLQELHAALASFVRSVPIGALSPGVARTVEAGLREAGVDPQAARTRSFDELGAFGRALADDVVARLRAKHPAAFVGAVAAGGAGAAKVAHDQGSAGLAKWGLAPQLARALLKDHLALRVRADFAPGFDDVRVAGGAAATTKRGPLDARVAVDVDGDGRIGGDARVGWERGDVAASTTVAQDAAGARTASAQATSRKGPVDATATAAIDAQGNTAWSIGATTAPAAGHAASVALQHDGRVGATYAIARTRLQLSAQADHDPATNATTLGVTAATTTRGGELAATARVDANGKHVVGVGGRFKL